MMGYNFDGFFVHIEKQASAQEIALSVKQQWPYVVCRRIYEPFSGLGIRMTSFAQVGAKEEDEQLYALKEGLPVWSKHFPTMTCLYLSADCFAGVCIYEGYLCRDGAIFFEEEAQEGGTEVAPLVRLLEQFGVRTETGYFMPLERGFFGPEKYFYPFEPEEDLETYLSADWFYFSQSWFLG